MDRVDLAPFHRAWERFSGWLATNAPYNHATLGPPATEEQIAAVEEAYGFALHPELKALLRLHNGTPPDASQPVFASFLPIGHRLSSTNQIIGARQTLMHFYNDFPENWGDCWEEEEVLAHSHQWVVFAEPNDGGMAFIDHRPGPTYGHVYEFGMGSGASEVTEWATSLSALFDALATAVETGTPFQGSHPTFLEFARTDIASLAPLVGRRFLEWNTDPQGPVPDDYIVHPVTGSR